MPTNDDMPIEKQLDLLVEKFGTFEIKLDTLDKKVDAVDKKVDAVDKKVGALESDLTSLKAHVGTLDSNVSSLGSAVGRIDARLGIVEKKVDKLQITSEASHDLIKIGLEGLEGLRESTVASFEEMSKEHAEQTDLLKSAVIHVRQRVERVERPKPRRRRS